MEFVQHSAQLQYGVDRFDGTRAWRTASTVISADAGSYIAATAFFAVTETALRPDSVALSVFRLAERWSWLYGCESIALADGVRLRPDLDPGLETEVLDAGQLCESVLLTWTPGQFRTLALARVREIRIGSIEMDLRPLTAGMRALLAELDSVPWK